MSTCGSSDVLVCLFLSVCGDRSGLRCAVGYYKAPAEKEREGRGHWGDGGKMY